VIDDNQAHGKAEKNVKNFHIEKDTLCCTDASALQALIPYVKRLLQLFLEEKEKTKLALTFDSVRNRVYQFETRRYYERISQSQLEFNCDYLSFRESLDSDQKKFYTYRCLKGMNRLGQSRYIRFFKRPAV
jgi:thiamine kinase-like enzyme